MHKEDMKIDDFTSKNQEIFTELITSGNIFQFDYSDISKYLLKEYLNADPLKVDGPSLIASYLQHMNFDERISATEEPLFRDAYEHDKDMVLGYLQNEDDFHKYICLTYFELEKKPSEELELMKEVAEKDLAEIKRNLSRINDKIGDLCRLNNTLDIQNKVPILKHFEEMNQKAEEEIHTFLESGIEKYVLDRCVKEKFGSVPRYLRNPYRYRINPKTYSPHYPNKLLNKIDVLPLGQLRKLHQLYVERDPEFYIYIKKSIDLFGIFDAFTSLISENHILQQISDVLLETFAMYNNGFKIGFCNIVPSIIEGIIHELCLIELFDENELLNDGFQQKLNKLKEKLGAELFYEYYSFDFRLFRNKVSHGRLDSINWDDQSHLLLLDLYHVCQLVKSDKLQLNIKIGIVNYLYDNIAEPNYKYLMKYFLLDKVPIPDFYGLEEKIADIENLAAKDGFWEFFHQEIEKDRIPASNGIWMVIIPIKNKKIAVEKCVRLLQEIKVKHRSKDMADQYFAKAFHNL